MKELQLQKSNLVCLVDDEDFEELSKYKWSYNKYRKAIQRTSDKKKLHRVIMKINDPKVQVDHLDGNTLNNITKDPQKVLYLISISIFKY